MLRINSNIGTPADHIVESLGFLPYWVRDFCAQADDEHKQCDLVEYMTEQYGFGKLYKFGSTLKNGKLISEYEEDDDMEWIALQDTPVGDVWYFPYAIVALPRPEENDYFITRMD